MNHERVIRAATIARDLRSLIDELDRRRAEEDVGLDIAVSSGSMRTIRFVPLSVVVSEPLLACLRSAAENLEFEVREAAGR